MITSLVLAAVLVTRVPAPDFKSAPVTTVPAKAPIVLTLVSNTANQITDDDEWFRKNELRLNRQDERPENMPAEVDGAKFLFAIPSAARWLGLYGPDYAGATHVVGVSDAGEVEFMYDFSAYRFAPNTKEEQRVLWAESSGDVLYVSHGHHGYAKDSRGMNAYITAIDVRTGKPLWHSAPLVANAANFQFAGAGHLITGYGFTAEPDFLYVLRTSDGKAVVKMPLKSGPSYIVYGKGSQMYVRTYNRDYVFDVRQR